MLNISDKKIEKKISAKKISDKKIFNLSKNYDFIVKYDVQNNIKNLHKMFGSEFLLECNINNKNIKIPVFLTYTSQKFYRLFYNIEDKTSTQLSFKIDFIDDYTKKLNDICYISNIHKTDSIKGSEMIQLVNEINKKMGVKTAFLHDATTVYCGDIPYDLTFMKLIESNMGFYMKYGFDIDNWKKKEIVLKLVKSCRTVKNNDVKIIYTKLFDLIMSIINNENEKNNIKFYEKYSDTPDDYDKWLAEYDINEVLENVNNLLKLLNTALYTSEIYLYQTMVRLFKDRANCLDYNIIYKNCIDTRLYKIVYKNIVIEFTIFDDFRNLKENKPTSYSNTYR
jgi:hypothetical protein